MANYNAYSIDTCPSYTSQNEVCDEEGYINNFAPELSAAGWDAHFIVDTGKIGPNLPHRRHTHKSGRNGKQPTGQNEWGDWCNSKGTGFGVRPSTDTGNENVDAFVWIKPGGESDGTSDQSAERYDAHCGADAALKPAPEAGTWFQVSRRVSSTALMQAGIL